MANFKAPNVVFDGDQWQIDLESHSTYSSYKPNTKYTEAKDSNGNTRVLLGDFDDQYAELRHYSAIVNALTEKQPKEKKMTELYTVTGGDNAGKFVTKIGMNSAGFHVVEVRGTGEVFSVSGTHLEKVMPYTVDVRYTGGNSQKYSFFSNKGDVNVGDVIVSPAYGSPMLVVAVDTKAPKATTWLTGSVIVASKVIEAPKD